MTTIETKEKLISLPSFLLGCGVCIPSLILLGKYLYQHKHHSKRKDEMTIPIMNDDKCIISCYNSNYPITIVERINSFTFTSFNNEWNKIKDENYNIGLETLGGEFNASQMICEAILQSNKKVIVNIPNYACSGGLGIALCADEIIVRENTMFGPCDILMSIEGGTYSELAISEAINYKKEQKEGINEKWLTSSIEAQKSMRYNIDFLNKICKKRGYDSTTFKKIQEELFSGKHPHVKVFTVNDLINMGITTIKVDNNIKQIKG